MSRRVVCAQVFKSPGRKRALPSVGTCGPAFHPEVPFRLFKTLLPFLPGELPEPGAEVCAWSLAEVETGAGVGRGEGHTTRVDRSSEIVLRNNPGLWTEGSGELGPQLMFLLWVKG